VHTRCEPAPGKREGVKGVCLHRFSTDEDSKERLLTTSRMSRTSGERIPTLNKYSSIYSSTRIKDGALLIKYGTIFAGLNAVVTTNTNLFIGLAMSSRSNAASNKPSPSPSQVARQGRLLDGQGPPETQRVRFLRQAGALRHAAAGGSMAARRSCASILVRQGGPGWLQETAEPLCCLAENHTANCR
jgi:hypothetical protein